MSPAILPTTQYICFVIFNLENNMNTSLAGKGALAHHLHRRTACNTTLPAMSHCLQNQKLPLGDPKMA